MRTVPSAARQAGSVVNEKSREYSSCSSNASAARSTHSASSFVNAKLDTQSRDRPAGTTPRVLKRPREGFKPTMLLNEAGTRPEPAVSVPNAKLTNPRVTATAEPLLDPPEMYEGSNAFAHAPYGERVPTRPVANWSRFVFPIGIAPALINRCTTVAERSGTKLNEGHPAVVGTPARSMLSFTANGAP